jgi:hypothetical protein
MKRSGMNKRKSWRVMQKSWSTVLKVWNYTQTDMYFCSVSRTTFTPEWRWGEIVTFLGEVTSQPEDSSYFHYCQERNDLRPELRI